MHRLDHSPRPRISQYYKPEIAAALKETASVTAINFWPHADWPDLGDRWGIILEELIVGSRSDIPAALQELEDYAIDLVARRQ